jgi:hypothetical protein
MTAAPKEPPVSDEGKAQAATLYEAAKILSWRAARRRVHNITEAEQILLSAARILIVADELATGKVRPCRI